MHLIDSNHQCTSDRRVFQIRSLIQSYGKGGVNGRKCISELQSRGDTGRFSLEQKLPRCCLRRPARPKRRSVCLYGLLYNSGRRNERFRGKVRTAAFKSTQTQTADVVVHYR